MSLFNVTGQLIANLLNADSYAGQYQFSVGEEMFKSNGTYIVKLSTGNEVLTKTIIK